jgi:hypothetical protein
MTTWINDMKNVDDYVTGKLSPEETLLFEARLLLDPALKFRVALQRKIISIARMYGRKTVKSEVENIGQKLFSDQSKTGFHHEVNRLFGDSC